MRHAGIDRLTSMLNSFELVRRGGTVSRAGVYGGESDPLPIKSLFDKGVTIRMGQCNVKRWIDELLPLVEDTADSFSLDDLVTHTKSLEDAPKCTRSSRRRKMAASRLSSSHRRTRAS